MEQAQGSPWFWSVIASSERRLTLLARQLEKMSRDELLEYVSQYEDAKDAINPYSFERPIWPTDAFSEDSADDFTEWVVSLGEFMYGLLHEAPTRIHKFFTLFEEAERDEGPNRWDTDVDRPEYRGSQSPCGLAVAVYESRFGRTFFKDLREFERRKDGSRA